MDLYAEIIQQEISALNLARAQWARLDHAAIARREIARIDARVDALVRSFAFGPARHPYRTAWVNPSDADGTPTAKP